MSVVTDVTSNRNEKIVNAAKVLGRSTDRQKVFLAVYKGKKKIKNVSTIFKLSGLKNKKRVLEEGQKLFSENLVGKTKVDGETAYIKIRRDCREYLMKTEHLLIGVEKHVILFVQLPLMAKRTGLHLL